MRVIARSEATKQSRAMRVISGLLRRRCAAPRNDGGSHFMRFQRRRMKQFLDREPARGQSLAVVVTQERLDRVPVRLDAVGPEIIAHERARGLELLFDERERDLGARGHRDAGPSGKDRP